MGTCPGNSDGMNYERPDRAAVLSGILLLAGVILMMFIGLLDIWF